MSETYLQEQAFLHPASVVPDAFDDAAVTVVGNIGYAHPHRRLRVVKNPDGRSPDMRTIELWYVAVPGDDGSAWEPVGGTQIKKAAEILDLSKFLATIYLTPHRFCANLIA